MSSKNNTTESPATPTTPLNVDNPFLHRILNNKYQAFVACVEKKGSTAQCEPEFKQWTDSVDEEWIVRKVNNKLLVLEKGTEPTTIHHHPQRNNKQHKRISDAERINAMMKEFAEKQANGFTFSYPKHGSDTNTNNNSTSHNHNHNNMHNHPTRTTRPHNHNNNNNNNNNRTTIDMATFVPAFFDNMVNITRVAVAIPLIGIGRVIQFTGALLDKIKNGGGSNN